MNVKPNLLAAAAAFVFLSWPQTTAAQAWIGQIAGEAAAREMRALEEESCRNGVPASAQTSRIARSAAERLLAEYFALHGGSISRDIWNVFDRRAALSWADTSGYVPVTSLGTRLDEPTPVLGRAVFVVGGDGESARGVWTVNQYGRTTGYYRAVFVHLRSDWSPGSWRIQHMTVWPGDMRPAEPGAYCHLDPSHLWPIPTNFQARNPSPLLSQAAGTPVDNSAAAQEAAEPTAHSIGPVWAVRPRPEYPERAFASGVTARVVVRCTVGPDGVPTNCGIISETPAGMGFWQAAMNSLHGARFATASEGTLVQFTLSFNAPPPETP